MAEEIENTVSEDAQVEQPEVQEQPTPPSDSAETPAAEAVRESTETVAKPVEEPRPSKVEGAGAVPEQAVDTVAGPAGQVEAAPAAVRRKGRASRHVPVGIAHIKATFNNTVVSITDTHGGVVSWSTAGRAGFKGSRKSTAFAATLVAQEAARQAVGRGMHEVEVRIQGAGAGRESAIRGLQSSGLNVSVIKDVTPIAHNGCRPRKRRRV